MSSDPAVAPRAAALHLEHLSVGHGRMVAVRDLELTLVPGSLTVVLGANGAGKTTLLRTIAGLAAPLAGRVRCGAIEPHRLPLRERARLLAYIRAPESEQTAHELSVRDIVRLGRAPHRPWWQWRFAAVDAAAVDAAMERCDVAALAERGIEQLSGGERQRVWLASALAQAAPAIVLDEPTSRLDLRYAYRIMRLLRETAAAGALICTAMHDLQLAAAFADRVLVIGNGRLLADGPPALALTHAVLEEAYATPLEIGHWNGGIWVRVEAAKDRPV